MRRFGVAFTKHDIVECEDGELVLWRDVGPVYDAAMAYSDADDAYQKLVRFDAPEQEQVEACDAVDRAQAELLFICRRAKEGR